MAGYAASTMAGFTTSTDVAWSSRRSRPRVGTRTIRHLAYPVIERAGLLLAYMGKGEPPLLPSYEFLSAMPEHRYLQKTFMECNYLQALEGDIDPAHISYLHRSLQRRPSVRKVRATVPGGDKPAATLLREDRRPG